MRFYTKYDLPEKTPRKFDSLDKVDRLSFCDTTIQIQRFLEAGKNLRFARNQASYGSAEEVLLSNDRCIPCPVFQEDNVDMKYQIDSMKNALGKRISEKILKVHSRKSVSGNETHVEAPDVKVE